MKEYTEWQKKVDRYYAEGYVKAVEEWHRDGCSKPLSCYISYWESHQIDEYVNDHEPF